MYAGIVETDEIVILGSLIFVMLFCFLSFESKRKKLNNKTSYSSAKSRGYMLICKAICHVMLYNFPIFKTICSCLIAWSPQDDIRCRFSFLISFLWVGVFLVVVRGGQASLHSYLFVSLPTACHHGNAWVFLPFTAY